MIRKCLLACVVSIPLLSNAALADELIAKGKTVYDTVGGCTACHGPVGAGDGPAAVALNPRPQNLAAGSFKFDTDKDGATGTEADLFNVISNGAAQYSGSPSMVGRADISEDDRKALVKYVLSLSGK
ncbi:MAG: cytochrome c [bacterium]|nr:cytochrome c [bacterium]